MHGHYWELQEFCKRARLPNDSASSLVIYQLEPDLLSTSSSSLRLRFPRAVLIDVRDLPGVTRSRPAEDVSDGCDLAGFGTDDSEIVSVASAADSIAL
jgi:hypothetical protein